MPLIFDATTGGADANSYCTVAEADAHHAGRIGADAWHDQDGATKALALVAATERLETERWRGAKATRAQRLRWPRAYVPDPDPSAEALDSAGADGAVPELSADAIPRAIVAATCELAKWMLDQGVDVDAFAATGLEGFARLKVGALEIERDRDAAPAGALPDVVTRWLRGLRAPRTATRIARG